MKIMDINSFLIEMDNDYDDVSMIVNEFTSSIEVQIPQMIDHFQTGDFLTLSREAHSIKGGARNLMAPRLEYAAEDLEKSASKSDRQRAEKYLTVLRNEFLAFKNFVGENIYINH